MSPPLSPANRTYTIVGPGSVLEGDLELDHDVRIDGTLRGDVRTSRSLIVGPSGEVQARLIEVEEAVVNGKVSGRLKARHSVHLAASAVFRGTIETVRLVVEEGADVEIGEQAVAP